jgi:hypothetical protein
MGIIMLYEKERFKVSNIEGTVSVYVMASNVFEAIDRAREISGSEDFKIVQRIERCC